MSKFNINSSNIKLTILDDGKNTVDSDDCYFKVIFNIFNSKFCLE